MLYLNCEVKSGLGEDTFWTWLEREFPSSSFNIPQKLNDDDIVLRYSTLGFLPIEGKQLALCWELYPQMKKQFGTNQYDSVLANVYECAKYSTYRTVATERSIEDYIKFGSVDIIPIAVNTDLYKPLNKKLELRKKYDLPLNKEIGIWIGTCHPMKGYSTLLKFASDNPNIHWVVVWKWEVEAMPMKGASNFIKIPQRQLNELLNAADFFASTNKLNSFFMAEWEAMAADVPFQFIQNEQNMEFIPSERPRDDVFERGWDRESAKKKWMAFFEKRGVRW